MPGPRLALIATPSSIQSAPGSVGDAIQQQRQLTDRDRYLISLLADHHVLTTEQITRLAFGSDTSARHRLTLLTQRGVLARFRRCMRPGSQSWRYTLGVNGALMHAAASGHALPKPSTVAEKILKLAESPKLNHLIGVNEFFVSLIRHSRTKEGCALSEWWSEKKTTAACGEIAHPDSYGEWTENGRIAAFFLEYDTGTETIPTVWGKMRQYRNLVHAGISKPILFMFPSAQRENNFHRSLSEKSRNTLRGLVVATSSLDHVSAADASPADRVWWPPFGNRRHRLIEFQHLADRPLPATS